MLVGDNQAASALANALRRAMLAVSDGEPKLRRINLPHPFSNMTREQWKEAILLWRTHGLALLRAQPRRPCPACKSTSATPLFESYDGYVYVECDACGTWYVPLVIDHELFERYFVVCPEARRYGDYTIAQVSVAAAEEADRTRFSAYYADLLEMLGPQPGKTLDIGCGTGNSLIAAQAAGFEAYGFEVNAEALAAAAARGRRVLRSTENLPEGSFSAVTLWESLEHMSDPDATLALARRMLTRDGVLAFSVPNLNSPIIRSMRGDSMQVHGGPAWPGHINVFTPSSVEILLQRAGFEVIDMSGQYAMNLFEFVAYHLGAWRGARDYLDREPVFDLPEGACVVLDGVASAIAQWEELCAMGPILRVTARPTGGGAKGLREARWAQARAAHAESERATAPAIGPRGAALSLTSAAYCAPNVRCDGMTLEVQGAPEGARTYAWMSHLLAFSRGDTVLMRGKLRGGGFALGLLHGDAWAASAVCAEAGLFELALEVRNDVRAQLVISNHLEDGENLDLTIDRIEIQPVQ